MRRCDTIGCRKILAGILAPWLVGLAAGVASAQAVYVVDTGPGADTGGLSLSGTQSLAGRFTLDLGHELYGLEGWIIYPTITGSLPVRVVLYEDFEGLPDTGAVVHSQLFTVPASGIPFAAGWHGISGVTIPVYGGTYWLAFELPSGDFGSGAMPPTPLVELDDYAVDSGGGFASSPTARIGIRVLPEPGQGVMSALGAIALVSLGSTRRRGSGSARAGASSGARDRQGLEPTYAHARAMA